MVKSILTLFFGSVIVVVGFWLIKINISPEYYDQVFYPVALISLGVYFVSLGILYFDEQEIKELKRAKDIIDRD